MLDKKADHVFAAVTGCPEERVPAVALASRTRLLGQPVLGLLHIVLLAGLEEVLVLLLLFKLLFDFFFLIVIVHCCLRNFGFDVCHRCC